MPHDLPPITRSHALMTPFQCRVFTCFNVAAWTDSDPAGMTVGFCDAHRTTCATVPISVHGREHEGWERWPMTLVKYLKWRDREAG